VVSLPFQSSTNFNNAPFNQIRQPDPIRNSNTNGIGDITQSLFLSPVHSGALI